MIKKIKLSGEGLIYTLFDAVCVQEIADPESCLSSDCLSSCP